MAAPDATLLGLDVGNARVGVAVARLDVRLPRPLVTLAFRPEVFDDIRDLVRQESAAALVVGWPRGLDGQTTGQTKLVEEFAEELRKHTGLEVVLQDEALTSKKAEAELRARNKPYEKGDVDALAATYILEDYLAGLAGDVHV